MKVLGVNAAQASLWLCVVDDGVAETTDPPSLTLRNGVAGGYALLGFHGECVRVLARLAPDRIVILDPEPMASLKASARPRFSAEALLAFAAEQAKINCERITRAMVRSCLHFERKGALKDHVRAALPEPVGPHWAGKRDLAALAALAVLRG